MDKHEEETATPDDYAVTRHDDRGEIVRTEMTATTRCAYMRFTFPASESSLVIVEASRPGIAGYAKVDAARREIVGYNPEQTDDTLRQTQPEPPHATLESP